MVDALEGAPVIPFRRPGGITMVPVHAETGERVSPSHKMAVMEVFKPGQRPKTGTVIDFPGSSGQQSVDVPALY
jgi:penicillin-binding protein 1A